MSTPWVKAGTFIVADKLLEYTCLGPPPNDAPTLILLHEGLGCIRLWRDIPASLSQATGFGVLVYSRAGYGQSELTELPRPLDYMTREAIDVLPGIFDDFGVQNAVLLGHSDGATIAAIHAGLVADPRVMGAVLIAPHFFTETAGLIEIAKARDAFNHGDLRARLGKYHRDPDNAFRGWNDSWLDPDFEAWNVADVLDNIRVPVLAIQGCEDPYGTLAQINVITDRVEHADVTTLILDDCNHAPHLEHSAEVVAAIAKFCKRSEVKLIHSEDVPLTFPTIQLPSHAYIPGKNARHPENAFDVLRVSATVGQDANQLAQCQAFRAGLMFLEAGFYWEAHEVLEPVWMILAEHSVERRFVQGLIQLANGCLKLRMGWPKAALRLVGQARALVPSDAGLTIMTLDVAQVHERIDALEDKIKLAL